MKYINELIDGEVITEIYFCKSKVAAQTKAGKSYFNLVFQDKTGTVDGKIWDPANVNTNFEAKDYVKIEAQVTTFNDAKQLNVRKVTKANPGEYNEAEYMPYTPFNIDDMYTELLGLISKVKNVHYSKLLNSFFVEDEAFVKAFKFSSAAKTVHHGFIGGLLQHSLSVAKLCDYYCDNYPILNRDLLLTAAICHDIGKVYELSSFPENDYTDAGQFMGHIVMGAMMVRDKLNSYGDVPTSVSQQLIHCILSHHGELEFGSPKKPAIIEAVALSYADNTDAKIQTFTELLEKNEGNDGWLGFDRFLETNVIKTKDEQ